MSTPRISGQLISSFVGRNVIIVGKVLQLLGDSAVIDAEGQVTVILTRVSTRFLPFFYRHSLVSRTDLAGFSLGTSWSRFAGVLSRLSSAG